MGTSLTFNMKPGSSISVLFWVLCPIFIPETLNNKLKYIIFQTVIFKSEYSVCLIFCPRPLKNKKVLFEKIDCLIFIPDTLKK